MKLSQFEKVALLFIADQEDGVYTKDFARYMWPHSRAWTRVYNVGPEGAASGVGIMSCAGGHLARLCLKGLLVRSLQDRYGERRRTPKFYVSQKGEQALLMLSRSYLKEE